jgi:uncharacterized DUF497 family protein
MPFEWDAEKSRRNQQKHEVSFIEAATVFADPLAVTYADPLHSSSEDRYLTFGLSMTGAAVVVAHTSRGDTIRIISARRITSRERRHYEQQP